MMRSTVFRLAMLFASIFTILTICVFAVLYLKLSGELDARLRAEILETQKNILETQDNNPSEPLAQVVQRYAFFDKSTDDVFLFVDADGHFVAGNIKPIPLFPGWKRLTWADLVPLAKRTDDDEPDEGIMAKWTKVKGGSLLIGDSDEEISEARDILLVSLAAGTLIMIASALAGASLLGAVAQRRVHGIETTLEAVARGELDVRVPDSNFNDDFSQIGARINLTLDRLQSLFGTLRQVSTDIAHDLRTPIARIRQRLEGVLSTASGPQNHPQAIESAINEIDDVMETFEALLRIAEIEAGARRSSFKSYDLVNILSNVVESFEPVAADAGQHLVSRLGSAGAAHVLGDEKLLTQLFVNVVENAIRHCPVGSRISIELNAQASSPEAVVRDDGPGIPEADRERVFRRLYRLEKSRTSPGHGLGLSLVAAIAHLHGAETTLADNNPGLTVSVRFPDQKRFALL